MTLAVQALVTLVEPHKPLVLKDFALLGSTLNRLQGHDPSVNSLCTRRISLGVPAARTCHQYKLIWFLKNHLQNCFFFLFVPGVGGFRFGEGSTMLFFTCSSLPKNYFRLKKKISYKLLWCIKMIWYILKILRCLITLCDLDIRFRTSSWLCDLICMLFNFLTGRNCVSLNTKVHIHADACFRHVMIFNWKPKKQ